MDEKYFIARITTDMVDDNTGKIKKMREKAGEQRECRGQSVDG